MKNLFMYSYNPASEGSKELAEALGVKRIKLERSRFNPTPDKRIINWGSSQYPDDYDRCVVLNRKRAVALASNKLRFFQTLDGKCRTVPYTVNIEEAKKWLKDGHTVCARTKLQASGGEGLVLIDRGSETFDKAPLYTKYVKKRDEYRIHLFKNEVISVQRKALRTDQSEFTDVDHRVRNLANGYVFVRNDVNPPEDVLEQSVLAIKHSGLDFGAVDVIWNEKSSTAYVLEVNTAPGLSGTTITDYASAFKRHFGES